MSLQRYRSGVLELVPDTEWLTPLPERGFGRPQAGVYNHSGLYRVYYCFEGARETGTIAVDADLESALKTAREYLDEECGGLTSAQYSLQASEIWISLPGDDIYVVLEPV